MDVYFVPYVQTQEGVAVADPRFLWGGEGNPRGRRQHTILPNFPKNCMKFKKFGSRGARRFQNITM